MLTIPSIGFLHDGPCRRGSGSRTSLRDGSPLADGRTRSAPIDFLRGMAIFAVLLLHFSLTYRLVDSPLSRFLPEKWLRAAIENGNYGVTIFFVISGFLITSNNLLRYGQLRRVNLGQFYAFRFSRIIPPLVLALTVIVLLGVFGLPSFGNSDGGHRLPTAFFLIAVLSVLTFWHNVLMEAMGYFNYCLNIWPDRYTAAFIGTTNFNSCTATQRASTRSPSAASRRCSVEESISGGLQAVS